MAAPLLLKQNKSPAERLDVETWREVLQFLNVNEFAKAIGISRDLKAAGGVKKRCSNIDVVSYNAFRRSWVYKGAEDAR
jgi:hypothetical protein